MASLRRRGGMAGSGREAEDELTMEKRFDASTVWVARFYPYTFSNLKAYIQSAAHIPHMAVTTPGATQDGYPIRLLTLTDFDVSPTEKNGYGCMPAPIPRRRAPRL
jgi:hypothetical protein